MLLGRAKSRGAEAGVGMSSLLVLVLCCLPAVAQILHVLRRAAIRLPVVIATVPVIIATEATEFPRVGAGDMGRGGSINGEKGLQSPRDQGREGQSGRLTGADFEPGCVPAATPHPGAILPAPLSSSTHTASSHIPVFSVCLPFTITKAFFPLLVSLGNSSLLKPGVK